MQSNSPLGKQAAYPNRYSPAVLCPIGRADSRAALGLGVELPFKGVDIWNAWELSWLGENGLPRVAQAEIRVPAESPDIVESKSLKLYLNSFSMSRFESAERVAVLIARDLSKCVGTDVSVQLEYPQNTRGRRTESLDGTCIDDPRVDCDIFDVDASLLSADASESVDEVLYSDLLRSQCPVTSQPDSASVSIAYRGARIDRRGLLRYVVSFRNHKDFHEACVERMFVDIVRQCAPSHLSVYARYQRRGGIDINPFRSTGNDRPANLRLWQQ